MNGERKGKERKEISDNILKKVPNLFFFGFVA